MREKLRVGVVNFQAAWGNIPENLARIQRICQKAKEQGAEMVVFPEVAVSGYSILEQGAMQKNAAEQIPGACSQKLCQIAKELELYLAVGMPERDGKTGDIYNSLLAVSPMGVDAVYRKIHPFGHESLWCKKGQAPVIWQTPWGKIPGADSLLCQPGLPAVSEQYGPGREPEYAGGGRAFPPILSFDD